MQEKKQIIQFSKIFKVISTIIMWIMIISSAIIAISGVVIAIAMKNVEIDNGTIRIMDEEILKIETESNTIKVLEEEQEHTFTIDEDSINIVNTIIEKINSQNATIIIESFMIAAIIESILLIIICTKAKNIFQDIIEKETPFVESTPKNLRMISYIVIATMVLDIIYGIALSIIIKTSISYSIPVTGILIVLFLFFLEYISNYGYKLENKKGK